MKAKALGLSLRLCIDVHIDCCTCIISTGVSIALILKD